MRSASICTEHRDGSGADHYGTGRPELRRELLDN